MMFRIVLTSALLVCAPHAVAAPPGGGTGGPGGGSGGGPGASSATCSAPASDADTITCLRNWVNALAVYLSVDSTNHDVILTGANFHVRSGSDATDDGGTPLGLGNLIAGYD